MWGVAGDRGHLTGRALADRGAAELSARADPTLVDAMERFVRDQFLHGSYYRGT